MTFKQFWASASVLGKICIGIATLLFAYSIFSEISIWVEDKTVSEQLLLINSNQALTISGAVLKFYVKNLAYIWYSIFLLICTGLFNPFKKSFQTEQSLVVQFAVSVSLSVSFLIISLIYLSRQAEPSSGSYTVVIGVFTVFSVSIGWLISTQLSRMLEKKSEKRANRHHTRTHTLNIILQLNTSRDYHEKMELINSVFPLGTVISDADVKVYLKGETNFEDDKDSNKLSAMTSLGLMLDTYEFIFEGIAQGDLDENVIYESIGGGIIRNVKRASPLINAIRQGTYTNKAFPKVFCRLVEYYHIWEPKHSADERKYRDEFKEIKVI